MANANEIIVDALTELVVQADEAPIEPSEAQTAIRYLNRMMYALDAEGISLGYNVVENLGDPITTPLGSHEGMIFNLALRLATQFDVPITLDLVNKAKEGKEAMRALSFRMGQTEMPSTLPTGSGNQGCRAGDEFKFFAGHGNNINTETNRNIIQEDQNVLNDQCINNDNEEAAD